ncbi:MAG: LptE family protein [Archangium sp.]|nr:LptE family protein [Archangium sp.]
MLLLLASCGYRFTAPNASLPGGIRTASVPFFINRTAEPGAELAFTQAARDQLDRAGRLGGPDADGVLEGTILSVGSGPFLAAPTLGRQPVFRMTAALTLTLKKSGLDVGTTTVSVSEEFPSGPDVLLTESNRDAALRRLADAAVREGLERLQTAP